MVPVLYLLVGSSSHHISGPPAPAPAAPSPLYNETKEQFSRNTVGKIYTPIFSFFQKRVYIITILELGLVSNEWSSGVNDFFSFKNFFYNRKGKILLSFI